jgi:hypothetical protein
MIETNIRIVNYGTGLHLDTRYVTVDTQAPSSELLWRLCGTLRYPPYGLAAIPYGSSTEPMLLVASSEPISHKVVKMREWRAEVRDSGQSRRLQFSVPNEASLIAQLMERMMLIEIARRTDMWTLDSPRIWYESRSFQTSRDISAYRRFGISVIPIEGVGLGVVTHVGTAFFTELTVADYLLGDSSAQGRFEFLSQRQKRAKGTLLYDLGTSKHKCYFEEFLPNKTCATIGPIVVHGTTYDSLFEYYAQKHRQASVKRDAAVAMVSFGKLGRQPVAANKLYLRVMNEALPKSLKQVDKIQPSERNELIREFWNRLGERPLGKGVRSGLWHPEESKTELITLPSLSFADNRTLASPKEMSPKAYKEHYCARRDLLNEVGCLDVPPAVKRQIYFALPSKAPQEMGERSAADVTKRISGWIGPDISYEVVPYSTIEEAYSNLREASTDAYGNPRPGMVVFVFEDEDPATYFNLSYNLQRWRVKRVTYDQLERHFHMQGGRWYSFVEMNALDVLQQLDCVPWSIAERLSYEAQLVIDVGAERRRVALSLLICRDEQYKPKFWVDTMVWQKSDSKQETINEVVLRDKIVKLFKRFGRRHFDPLTSILVLRDGRKCGREIEGIRVAQEKLVRLGFLDESAQVDIVDLHKRSMKGIRLWERDGGQVTNPLEGTAIFLDGKTVVLANTGSATLHLGTARPLMLVANDESTDMLAVANDVFATAQLNWSSPRVAQRLPLPSKRTDDGLRERAAQEIRRIR